MDYEEDNRMMNEVTNQLDEMIAYLSTGAKEFKENNLAILIGYSNDDGVKVCSLGDCSEFEHLYVTAGCAYGHHREKLTQESFDECIDMFCNRIKAMNKIEKLREEGIDIDNWDDSDIDEWFED